MSVKRQFTLKSGLLGLAMALAAGTAQAEISDGAIRIGYLVDMSGPYRDLAGPGGLEALQMAVEDHGSSIHGAPIEIFSADDRNSADVGASIVREWIDQRNIDMVAGLVASSVTIAVTRLIAEHDRIALSSGSAALGITNEHCSPNHIQWVYDTHAMSNGTARAIVEEGGKRWFILSADYAFGHSLEEEVSNVVTEMGGEVVGTVRHPLNNQDFSSFILQAQASGADVVALANAGADTTNAINTASEFGITQSGQTLAALLLFLTDVHALGVEAAQGIQLTTGWYWDMNDETRAWSDRFMEKTGVRPTMVHAGIYSSTLQYLKAVEATGSDDAQTVRKHMMETPINDMFAKNGRIRADGRMVHDMYLAEVKTPAESKSEWDLYKILRTIPADEAYRPLSESKCPLVSSK